MVRTLVVQHRDIVESKVSSNFAKKLKDDAWERITREYNAQEGVRPVTVTQIRKMWDNEKTRFKKRQAEATRDRYAPGKYRTFFSIRAIQLNTAGAFGERNVTKIKANVGLTTGELTVVRVIVYA